MPQSCESPRPRIPVLLYHRVATEANRSWRQLCVAPDRFAAQMRWLAEQGFVSIHLGQLLDYYRHGLPVPAKPVIITFDDGFFCNYSHAFPILRQWGFAATVFLVYDFIRRGTVEPGEGMQGYLAWHQILKMQEAGWEFHSHGLNHRPMTELSSDELAAEIGESRALIAARLGRAVEFFCYPFGKFNQQVQNVVRSFGYRGACGGPPFYAGGPMDEFAIGRTEILWDDSFRRFIFKIRHGLNYYYFLRKQLGNMKR